MIYVDLCVHGRVKSLPVNQGHPFLSDSTHASSYSIATRNLLLLVKIVYCLTKGGAFDSQASFVHVRDLDLHLWQSQVEKTNIIPFLIGLV